VSAVGSESAQAVPGGNAAVARVEQAHTRLLRQKRLWSLGGAAVFVLIILLSSVAAQFDPLRVLASLPRLGEFFAKIAPELSLSTLFADARTPGSLAYWFYDLDAWAWQLWITVHMAAFATVGATLIAFALSFVAARGMGAPGWLSAGLRRIFELMRTVPELVLAFIFVWAFGVGPLAGIAAIAIHSIGTLGKLFAEINENADLRAAEAVRASGGTWVMSMRYGVVPQVLPVAVSYALLRFEINVRSSTVIGVAGAGGIGQTFKSSVDIQAWSDVSAIVLLIIATVVVIDAISTRLRRSLSDQGRG